MKKRLPFEILYEDADVIVIDKPAGLLTTHTRLEGRHARETQRTAENILTGYVRKGQAKSSKRVWLVHRLDRDTSGVILFAKSERFADKLRENWNAITSKRYIARVEGTLDASEGVFESYLVDNPRTMKVSSVPEGAGGKYARTEWRRLEEGEGWTLVEAFLKTGRKNQIRVQFADAGHPVVGDVKYGARKARRLFLHSCELKIKLPSGERVFAAPIPF